jgi:hypothetical protein
MEKEQKIYYKGYREGAEAMLKMAVAICHEYEIKADNPAKPWIEEIRKKLEL